MNPDTPKLPRAPAVSAFAEYGKELHRFLLRRLGSAQDAADIAQEVYLRLTRLESLDWIREPRAYLYGVASHVVYEFRMRSRRDPVTYDSNAIDGVADDIGHSSPDTMAERLDAQRRLERAFSHLPPTHLAVLVLHKRDGMSYEEVARKLKLSVHTVHKYVIQAKAQVKLRWNDQD